MADYRVRTDVYNGPMDLLLYLIRRDEVDIYDIPIARITKQYCEYVELLETLDPNIAGEFLVMAAMLMEMKSQLLLPPPAREEGADEDLLDPRAELVRQLLEYKQFKDASFELGAAAGRQAQRWSRAPAPMGKKDAAEVDVEEVQIWDLVAAFNKLMSAIGATVSHEVVFDDTPIALHAADLLNCLQNQDGEMGFEEVFTGRDKVEMIGLFLALLELMRQQRVRIVQADMFSPIRIVLLSAEPIEIGDEWQAVLTGAVLGRPTEQSQQGASNDPAEGAASPSDTEDARDEPNQVDDEEEDRFEELDRIKTDVDIDAGPKQDADAAERGDREREQT